MAKVPWQLRRFLKKDHCGSRKLSRPVLAFRDRKKKKEFLSVWWVTEAHKAMVEFGADAKEVSPEVQSYLAQCLGITRSTFTHRLSQFAEERKKPCSCIKDRKPQPDCSNCKGSGQIALWDDARRDRHSLKMKEVRRRNGRVVKEASRSTRRLRRRIGGLMQRNRTQFGNIYASAMPDSQRPRIQREESKTLHASILAAEFGEDLFDPNKEVNGFKSSPLWLWDDLLPDADPCVCSLGQMALDLQKSGCGGLTANHCPICDGEGVHYHDRLPDYGRVLAHFLLDRGIAEAIGKEHEPGYKPAGELIGWTQKAIGDWLGMDESTVRKYERKLELLGIIRVYEGDAIYDGAGKIVGHTPHKIIWLPLRTLDPEIVEEERQRIAASARNANKRMEQQQQQKQLADAVARSSALLKEWEGSEHRLLSFWHEMRRRLARANFHHSVIRALFPFYRE